MIDGLRALAFYLPQFHPVPENDEWWGPGFTEWTNVAQARPLFRGHYQPHVPADLGFYDLRLDETRVAQAELARAHGIDGFCYYHYWFGGRRMLERPFREVLESGRPASPIKLWGANEDWTRAWDGLHSERLIEQHYSPEDDLAHIRWLLPAFADPRYIRVGGRPLFLVYKAGKLPDPQRTLDCWREEAARAGIGDLYLCRVESETDERGDPRKLGFDAAVEFQPDWVHLGRGWLRARLLARARKVGLDGLADRYPRIYDYRTVVDRMLARSAPEHPLHPCVTPGWDNTARRGGRGLAFHECTPDQYERWLRAVVADLERRTAGQPPDERLLFVNAWNEWAEGNHLEPDLRWGRAHLEATRRVLRGT